MRKLLQLLQKTVRNSKFEVQNLPLHIVLGNMSSYNIIGTLSLGFL